MLRSLFLSVLVEAKTPEDIIYISYNAHVHRTYGCLLQIDCMIRTGLALLGNHPADVISLIGLPHGSRAFMMWEIGVTDRLTDYVPMTDHRGIITYIQIEPPDGL
jgi:hypothetical protein